MGQAETKGRLAAIFTVLLWGSTFVSTKLLLQSFTPIEILFIRFVMGYLALWLAWPRPLKYAGFRQERLFAGAGLCGVALYYLLENMALTCTQASNVGVIVSVSPFFTALFSCLLLGRKWPGRRFFAGFFCAMTGICLLSLGDAAALHLAPKGDLLALAAALVWALYSILAKKIAGLGLPTIAATRRTFFYGLLCMGAALPVLGFQVGAEVFRAVNLFNLLFLGLGASALCFVTWNLAIRLLGPLKSSVYVYAVPVVTTLFSAWILHEAVTPAVVAGILLTLLGLGLSQGRA